jgi:hypothetical protein
MPGLRAAAGRSAAQLERAAALVGERNSRAMEQADDLAP